VRGCEVQFDVCDPSLAGEIQVVAAVWATFTGDDRNLLDQTKQDATALSLQGA
jgi:hypothetical protein